MAKGKPKKEKGKKKKGEEEKKTKELDGLKDKDEEESKIESDLELIRIQNLQLQEAQRQETRERLKTTETAIFTLREEIWNNKIWNRYISCDGEPSLDDIPQLNSFISKWLEPLQDEDKLREPGIIMQQCNTAFELLEELQQMKYEVDDLGMKRDNYEQVKLDLKKALNLKLNLATFESLLDMSLTIDSDSGNSYSCYENETVMIGIWANLVCNPRYNGYNSSEIGNSFTLPRDVINSECAIRIMKMDFDLFSPTSAKYTELNVPSFTYKFKENVMKLTEKKKPVGAVNDDWDEGRLDIREFFTIAPILNLQLVAVPSQPHQVKNWIMTKVENVMHLKFLPWKSSYVPPSLLSEIEKKDDDEAAEEVEKQRAINEMGKLVSVTWKLPVDVIFCDVPRLARWDSENLQWTTTGLFDVNYKEESTSMSFYTSHFGTFAVLLPKFVAFPYQGWELTPIVEVDGQFKANFSITTMTGSVEILIESQYCRLIQLQSNDKLYLESYYGKLVKPNVLLTKLQTVGFIITSNPDDFVLTNNIKTKSCLLEFSTYKQMALACAKFRSGFMNSRWNSNLGVDKIVVRLKDSSTANSKMLVLVTDDKALVLAVTELSQTFDEISSDSKPVSVDLYHLLESHHLQSFPNADNSDTSINSHEFYLFVNTMYQILATTRVFCN